MRSVFSAAILVFFLFSSSVVWAVGGLSVDAKFDLTGDGIVDASDWVKMTEDAKLGYANASIQALGEDPYVLLEGMQSRGSRYLLGLRSVYE